MEAWSDLNSSGLYNAQPLNYMSNTTSSASEDHQYHTTNQQDYRDTLEGLQASDGTALFTIPEQNSRTTLKTIPSNLMSQRRISSWRPAGVHDDQRMTDQQSVHHRHCLSLDEDTLHKLRQRLQASSQTTSAG